MRPHGPGPQAEGRTRYPARRHSELHYGNEALVGGTRNHLDTSPLLQLNGSQELLRLHTVTIGAGSWGSTQRVRSRDEGHDVVPVEKGRELVEKAAEELDAMVIAGNGADPELLNEAGIEGSDPLVAASNSDEVKIIACLAAKFQGVSRTVARIHNPDYYEVGEPFAEGDAGDRLHNPYGADGGAGDQGSAARAWCDQRRQLRRGHYRGGPANPERGLCRPLAASLRDVRLHEGQPHRRCR